MTRSSRIEFSAKSGVLHCGCTRESSTDPPRRWPPGIAGGRPPAGPLPTSQKSGLGFPQCRLVALLCLGSGALLDAASGPCEGKGSDEQSLLRCMLDTLKSDDILLGDAYYATYFLLCELVLRGVDGVFEQQGARKRSTDFRKGEKLGARDHLIVLTKPKKKPDWMGSERGRGVGSFLLPSGRKREDTWFAG